MAARKRTDVFNVHGPRAPFEAKRRGTVFGRRRQDSSTIRDTPSPPTSLLTRKASLGNIGRLNMEHALGGIVVVDCGELPLLDDADRMPYEMACVHASCDRTLIVGVGV